MNKREATLSETDTRFELGLEELDRKSKIQLRITIGIYIVVAATLISAVYFTFQDIEKRLAALKQELQKSQDQARSHSDMVDKLREDKEALIDNYEKLSESVQSTLNTAQTVDLRIREITEEYRRIAAEGQEQLGRAISAYRDHEHPEPAEILLIPVEGPSGFLVGMTQRPPSEPIRYRASRGSRRIG